MKEVKSIQKWIEKNNKKEQYRVLWFQIFGISYLKFNFNFSKYRKSQFLLYPFVFISITYLDLL